MNTFIEGIISILPWAATLLVIKTVKMKKIDHELKTLEQLEETLVLYKDQKKIIGIFARNANVNWLQIKLTEAKKNHKKFNCKK
mgnify:CR=1 FL=1